MYAVVGATGNTGSVVAEQLLAAGEKVRVIGRDPGKLARFTSKGAEGFLADVTDDDALGKAFAGAKAVYALIPQNASVPNVPAYQERVSDALASALASSGTAYAVVLSSVGADKPDKTGPVVGLRNLEQKLAAIGGLQALYLRADYFMENLLPQAAVIQSMGFIAGPLRSDLPIGMVATHDVGSAAAQALLRLDFNGKTSRELQGPRDVTFLEVAEIIAAAIGKPGLPYHQLPAMLLKPAMVKMGLSSSMVDLLLEMSDSLNSGYMKALEPRTPLNTAPTPLETFVAEVFVPAYRARATRA